MRSISTDSRITRFPFYVFSMYAVICRNVTNASTDSRPYSPFLKVKRLVTFRTFCGLPHQVSATKHLSTLPWFSEQSIFYSDFGMHVTTLMRYGKILNQQGRDTFSFTDESFRAAALHVNKDLAS